ncbi:MAG: hypothetical protein US86_C0007G0034 [Candidatus Daviesbacteria bacterium GW2011_GWA2_38_24]|uniref:Uncharacterized protein n=1 Tax=Candidatus Daviesbacteria bacterium GW2011_GWA2_38_24 TaxID=1618422 RepID=A0A0G0LX45_9BACT|nr:MAG: hypothetical protein US86_C0007G0034 [Candidatus Daviesbacteria bacterium GW2011_GWA2_38_24]KKQ80880.1 MAG: hypothetical protein UT01_C0005G0035 [Candidatus Daviesbacteria bacterium GW2011_GWA1_38_7]
MVAESLPNFNFQERRLFVNELLQNGVSAKIASSAAKRLRMKRHDILDQVVGGPWKIVQPLSEQDIPVKGRSKGQVSATVIDFKGREGVSLVLKPALNFGKASNELDNLELITRLTGVRSVRPCAALGFQSPDKVDGYSYVLTFTERGIVPLDKLNLKEYEPKRLNTFVTKLAEFVASWAEAGFIHGDAHLGNIGQDLTLTWIERGFDTRFMVFDLEDVRMLDKRVLEHMRNLDHRPRIEEEMQFVDLQERYIGDATTVLDCLRYDQRLDEQYVEQFARVYLDSRTPALGQRSKEGYYKSLVTGGYFV